MGCNQSRNNPVQLQHSTEQPQRDFNSNSPLTASEIQQRIEAPADVQTLKRGGVTMRYGWVSQRGYYPEAPDKDNQDAYMILPVFGPDARDQSYFAIFDGHGKDGHHCARFARDNLHKRIVEKLEKIPGTVNTRTVKQALSAAHYVTNDAMHSTSAFDDALSGTTAISIMFKGKTMYISNVGDSRAIIISENPTTKRLQAQSLSSDQTPYRKDERERIKQYGARILSMDQIEGIEPVHENWGDLQLGDEIDEGGDPPRVWAPNGDFPGTAFTRSLGDMYAEECGVTAEPEILERDLEQNDKYVIIASDGVFEFLTNQMVADIITRYPNPLDACRAVVQASYDMWLQYEVRTDDISIIAVYIDHLNEDAPSYATSVQPHYNASGVNFNRNPSYSASNTAEAALGKLIGNSASSEQVSGMINLSASMESVTRTNGSNVINEARPVRRVMSREKRKTMIQLKIDAEDDCSGDIDMDALMIAKSEEEYKTINAAIKFNFLFQHLNQTQRNAVIGVMIPVDVKAGDWIIKQGASGDRFYVVDSGKYEVHVKQNSNLQSQSNDIAVSMKRVSKGGIEDPLPSYTFNNAANSTNDWKEGDDGDAGPVVHIYEASTDQHPGFGELSLMYGKPRAASVIAVTDGKLWALDRKIFRRVVLRPKESRKAVIKTLRTIDLFKALTFQQLQRFTDLMSEAIYSPGQTVLTAELNANTFVYVLHGQCDLIATINTSTTSENNTGDSNRNVIQVLTDGDYYGEHHLVQSESSNVEIVANTTVKLLYIERHTFEEVFGTFAKNIEQDRVRRQTAAKMKAMAPQRLSDIKLIGFVSSDSFGPILLGSFHSEVPNLTVRSFLLSDIEQANLTNSVLRYLEAAKLISTSEEAAVNSNVFIPKPVTLLHDPNSLHLVLNDPMVMDLSSLLRENNQIFMDNKNNSLVYVFACLVSALESLHAVNILYRAVQPEGLYIDMNGKLVLKDFKVCKIGLIDNSARTFTLCGASDYLAPEQITQTGHSYPADLWSMGVLLYEMSTGSHPFSASSEVATYSKISSFGTKSFTSLKFPDIIAADTKTLINQLLMPVPEARVGAGSNGFTALKKHSFFKNNHFPDDWDSLAAGKLASPLMDYVAKEYQELLQEELDTEVLGLFTLPYSGDVSWLDGVDF